MSIHYLHLFFFALLFYSFSFNINFYGLIFYMNLNERKWTIIYISSLVILISSSMFTSWLLLKVIFLCNVRNVWKNSSWMSKPGKPLNLGSTMLLVAMPWCAKAKRFVCLNTLFCFVFSLEQMEGWYWHLQACGRKADAWFGTCQLQAAH